MKEMRSKCCTDYSYIKSPKKSETPCSRLCGVSFSKLGNAKTKQPKNRLIP